MKACTKCNTKSPATTDFFYPRSAARDGLASICKACHREYVNSKNRERRGKVIAAKNSSLYNLTIDTAGVFIKKTGIKIIPGEAYNIFACGCIIGHENDPVKYAYYPDLGTSNRTCPKHKPSAMIGKYKVCGGCGSEYFSMRVQASAACARCYGVKPKKKPTKGLRNRHLFDKKGVDCFFRVLECLDKWDGYDCIPCKGCDKFKKKEFDITDHLSPKQPARQYGNRRLSSQAL